MPLSPMCSVEILVIFSDFKRVRLSVLEAWKADIRLSSEQIHRITPMLIATCNAEVCRVCHNT